MNWWLLGVAVGLGLFVMVMAARLGGHEDERSRSTSPDK